MYFHDKRLQYPVRVDSPDPVYARMLQQAIGGIEGEIRVCMQYFFQAWGNRAPTTKYRDMLLNTATEEIGHIEMLATAVAMNLENAPTKVQEAGAADALAKKRFFAITLMRLMGALLILAGFVLIRGAVVLDGQPADRWIGVAVVLVGVFDFAVMPRILARRWRSPNQP